VRIAVYFSTFVLFRVVRLDGVEGIRVEMMLDTDFSFGEYALGPTDFINNTTDSTGEQSLLDGLVRMGTALADLYPQWTSDK